MLNLIDLINRIYCDNNKRDIKMKKYNFKNYN